MRKIEVIVHYPNESLSSQYITKATTQVYQKAVKKIMDESDLTILEKKELLNKMIDTKMVKYHTYE